MKKIKLPRGEWSYDPSQPLGRPGGFGEVFFGCGQGYDHLAIKKLKIEAQEAAHREMRIAEDLAGRELTHVIPILDAGLDAESDSYFVVMARAERSLQDEVDSGRTFSDREAADVLLAVATGLSELPKIVHRDLKPGNVLLHDGTWKVADFGIARFVEESTSLHTLRNCLSPPYAAPEQWRHERATAATDIYALGCIACALLTGKPPFHGPAADDFHQQHLKDAPPSLDQHDGRLRSIVSMMLRKEPQARPSLERVKAFLKAVLEFPPGTPARRDLAALANAAAAVAGQEAAEEAKRQEEIRIKEARNRLRAEAITILKQMKDKLFQSVIDAAPNARLIGDEVQLGSGALSVVFASHGVFGVGPPADAFKKSQWDLVAVAEIKVCQPRYHWSANLLFASSGMDREYRWWEVSFFSLAPERDSWREPTALSDLRDIDCALSLTTAHIWVKAEGPKPIDAENEEAFFTRWRERLALAAKGNLQPPSRLPIK